MTCPPHASPGSRCLRLSLLSGLVLLHAWLAVSQAQLTLDGSLGQRGPLAGPHYRIGAELGQIRGGNLFHSFGEFNVPTGGSATFSGPPAITNILGRVTGGQPSAIDGTLRSEIPGANLYLLNPSGVLFGPNASLNVSGSFHVSTADYLRFTDGATFAANLGQASVLTVAAPTAFGFLGQNPAPITIQGSTLQVPAGKAFSVVGGDIEIVGRGPLTAASVPTLRAPRGRVQLASVSSPGEVVLSPLELAPDLRVDAFARLGRLTLSQGAFIDVSGNGGGTMLVRSGHLRVDGSAMAADNLGNVDGSGLGLDLRIAADAFIGNRSVVTTDSGGTGRARDLRIIADSLHLDQGWLRSSPFAGGDGGNVEVRAGRLTLTRGSQISSSTFGSGRGGELTVVATDAIAISGRDQVTTEFLSGLFANTSGRGEAGRLFVSAPLLTMDDALIQSVAGPGSGGNAGDVEVRVGSLRLTGGAQINTTTWGPGRGGQLTVVASDTIAIAGQSSPGAFSGLFSSARERGQGGDVRVTARHIQLRDGGTISARSTGDGAAGTLMLDIGETFRTQGGRVATDTTKAGGGRIELTVGRLVQLVNSELTTSVQGGGSDAGNLTLEASFVISDDSQISATAIAGRGAISTSAPKSFWPTPQAS
jgi:filamentous hemagglutinin family protein